MNDKNFLINNGVNVEKSLELFGDMEMYNQTLVDFLNMINEKLNNLEKFKSASDMPNYAIVAHSIKSDARYLGFEKLSEIALDLELSSKENKIMYVLDNHDKLVNETKRMINVSNAYFGKETIKEVVSLNETPKDEAILVVDDSNLVANFVKKIFDDKYEVIIASDGEKAIEILSSETKSKIKCCMLDLNMPKVDGFGVLDFFKINSLFVSIPVVVITGNDTNDQVARAFTYPISDLLSKPFNERDIKRVLDKALTY